MFIGYIDPGTGSMLISATIALFSVGFFMLKGIIYRKFNIGGDKGQFVDPNHHYGLVFYSEGKQYWNVFKPLLEECAKRHIEVTFMTSDKNDPALSSSIEGVDTVYIGSGREGYFVLNRLRADMVVMTTPGLDVLEIKRSKNVKHYTHLTHAPGCVAGYKAYALDYFDSVLIGGTGDVDVIRYFESLRNLPKKEVEIIGHTYLDEYRAILKEKNYEYSMFDNKRTTILVSPTWSNHGLLMRYGETLLQKLVDIDLYNIIIRPHPQSLLTEKDMIDNLMNKFPTGDHLVWDTQVENLKSMSHADIMISDFSGIVFDFFTLFNKPILTMRSQYEKRGRDVIDMPDDPWDIQMLGKIGATLTESDFDNLPDLIESTITYFGTANAVSEDVVDVMDKYPSESAFRGMNYIESKYMSLRTQETETAKTTEKTFTGYMLENNKSWIGNFINGLIEVPMLFQISFASLFFVLIIQIGLYVFPKGGLNFEFYSRLLPLAIILALICLVSLVISTRVSSRKYRSFINEKQPLELKDLLLVFIPMTPIIAYILANQDILKFDSSLIVFLLFYVVSTVGVVIIPGLMSPILSKNLSSSIIISFLYITFNMASFGRSTNMKFISVVLLMIALLSFVLQYMRQKSILIVIAVGLFIVNLGSNFYPSIKDSVLGGNNSPSESVTTKLVEYTHNLEAVNNPDVYVLIYDSYENQETLEQYGYDNTKQMNYLLDDGFTIYDGSYSVTASSLMSISLLLHAEELELEVSNYREHIAYKAGGLASFKKLGYKMQSVQDSDYMTYGFTPQYDYYFPDKVSNIRPEKIIAKAVLEGEFRFDADFSTITQDDYLKAKEQVLKQNADNAEFLYTHSKYPGHSQNSGVLLPNETELHFEKLDIANKEMRTDIENIRNRNRDAIIIVAGDHGPYLTKNGIGLEGDYEPDEVDRLDIQDRFGTFLAISWPEDTFASKQDIKLIQDIIPAVMSYIYEDQELFESVRMKREILTPSTISGVTVRDGIIHGGKDDNQPLFSNTGRRSKNE